MGIKKFPHLARAAGLQLFSRLWKGVVKRDAVGLERGEEGFEGVVCRVCGRKGGGGHHVAVILRTGIVKVEQIDCDEDKDGERGEDVLAE